MSRAKLRRVAALAGLVLLTVVIGFAAAAIAAIGSTAIALNLGGSPSAPGLGETLREIAQAPGELAQSISTHPESLVSLLVAALVAVAPAMIAAPAIGAGSGPPRSLRWSIAGASILGGLVAIGVMGTALDVACLLIGHGGNGPWAWYLLHPLALFPAWAIAGTAWAFAIRRAGAAHDPSRIDRGVRWLFAGSCVELALAAPTLVVALRRERCECGWGSWWAMAGGTVTLAILCGPALLLLRSRNARMRWMRAVCPSCGYPRRGGSATCPECGTALAPAPGAQ